MAFQKISKNLAKPIDDHLIVCYYHIAVNEKGDRA